VNLKTAAGSATDLGVRFNLLGGIPTAAFVTLIASLVVAGAPASAPDPAALSEAFASLSGTDLVLLTAGVVVVGLILQPMQLPLVRLLEGYWGSAGVGPALAAPLVAAHERRREALRAASKPRDPDDQAARAAAVAAAWRLRHAYPGGPLLPTRLGNTLRAAEYRAGRPYGLDAVLAWPRLYPILPAEVRAGVDDLRLQLDVAVRFAAMFVASAVVSAGLLLTHGWWLLLPLGLLLLAVISYAAAVSAASAYGMAVESAFDLHHLDLRTALHLRLPDDRAAERAQNRTLSLFFRGVPTDLTYEHE
jgi:hypothetical protein